MILLTCISILASFLLCYFLVLLLLGSLPYWSFVHWNSKRWKSKCRCFGCKSYNPPYYYTISWYIGLGLYTHTHTQTCWLVLSLWVGVRGLWLFGLLTWGFNAAAFSTWNGNCFINKISSYCIGAIKSSGLSQGLWLVWTSDLRDVTFRTK